MDADPVQTIARQARSSKLNAFNFLKIASHFFSTYQFEPEKVDGFVQEIVETQPLITRSALNEQLKRHISLVKRYQVEFEDKTANRMNPFTIIRHCLYLSDKVAFQSILTNVARESFETWLINSAGEQH